MSKWSEFDLSTWGLDSIKDAHDEDEGRGVAHHILSWLKERGLPIPVKPKYLGLGAGMAYPELAFAEAFGIAASQITLLDKNFGHEALQRIRTLLPEVTLIDNQGIWSFLEDPTVNGFGVVSFFGLDHKLRKWTVPHIASNLSKVLVPDAVVCMYPGGDSELNKFWNDQGFIVLNSGRLQAYFFQPATPEVT